MSFTEIASFDVVHGHLSWPWISFDPSGTRLYFSSQRGLSTGTASPRK